VIVRVNAGWVVPIVAPVIRGGWIDVDVRRGEIVGVGTAAAASAAAPAVTLDLGDAVVLPGLANAHTHLELSHMAGHVPPAGSFVAWVRTMLAVRVGAPATVTDVGDAATRAIAAMHASGTAVVGDIGNTDAAVGPLAASALAGVHFKEAIGFRAASANAVAAQARLEARVSHRRLVERGRHRVAASVAPHAPYSTSAPLIQALVTGLPMSGLLDTAVPACPISSIHLGESPEEVEFLAQGNGPLRQLLIDLGAWDERWQVPGVGPVAYLEQLGALHSGLLVVHGTQLTPSELDVLAAAGATLVLCPRSNQWVGAGVPPVAAAVAAGVRLALGTDSLASVGSLNLFDEVAAARALAPDVPASVLLRAATLGGARALGCGGLGRLEPGASAHAVVRVPPVGVEDVEEWLVADAADTTDLRWLDVLVADAVA
jgi:cytosine/adenosine deaminase-related metal-dependent hydrolase